MLSKYWFYPFSLFFKLLILWHLRVCVILNLIAIKCKSLCFVFSLFSKTPNVPPNNNTSHESQRKLLTFPIITMVALIITITNTSFKKLKIICVPIPCYCLPYHESYMQIKLLIGFRNLLSVQVIRSLYNYWSYTGW